MRIPFNKPHIAGDEYHHIEEAVRFRQLSGNGQFTKRCQAWLETYFNSGKVLLTHSCTAALEMAALLINVGPGDEVIMPSYTFSSTATAFVLRGATPVFVDINPRTLNIEPHLIEAAISKHTKAIAPVHYAGVSCEMNEISAMAKQHNLYIVEDAAQVIYASYKDKPAGIQGDLSCLSFHDTKNIHCGEGGALIINNEDFAERAEILWEKGTNRSQFMRGVIDKYTWVDMGSSYLPSELNAAFLWAQLQASASIQQRRLAIWSHYHNNLAALEQREVLQRPWIPPNCQHNAHMYYILLPTTAIRNQLMTTLREQDIHALFHYVPLHSAPAGKRFARSVGDMSVTDSISERLLRLPLWPDMDMAMVDVVCEAITHCLTHAGSISHAG